MARDIKEPKQSTADQERLAGVVRAMTGCGIPHSLRLVAALKPNTIASALAAEDAGERFRVMVIIGNDSVA